MKKYWILIFILLSFDIQAGQCKIKNDDLAASMQNINHASVIKQYSIDLDSKEPVQRYIQVLPNRTMLVVEQKHCTIYNLTITLFLPKEIPVSTAPQILSRVLVKTPIWKKWFQQTNATTTLKNIFKSTDIRSRIMKSESFSYGLDDAITAQSESSEALLRVDHLDDDISPFSNIVSLYISVGGM
jgi:hypothetical protein